MAFPGSSSFRPRYKSPMRALEVDLPPGVKDLAAPSASSASKSSPLSSSLSRQTKPVPGEPTSEQFQQQSLDFANELELQLFGSIQDEVKEKAVTATLGKTVTSALGIVAVPFVAADIMDALAPGVHSWLRGGWKGATGVAPARFGAPLPPELGQCSVAYNYSFDTYNAAGNYTGSGSGSIGAGPVRTLGVGTYSTGQGQPLRYVIRRQAATGPVFSDDVGMSEADGTIRNLRPLRADGQADNCGTSSLGPDPVRASPRPSPSSPFHPNPTTPSGSNYPSTEALRESGEPPVPSKGRKSPAPSPASPFDWPIPSPESGTLPESLTEPFSPTYPKPPRNPVPPFTEGDSCDPCSFKLGQKLEEISDKLDEKKEDEENSECPPCESYPFVYSYGICDNGEFRTEQRTILLTQEPSSQLRAEFDSTLARLAEACGKDAVAAIPDWWQVRIGAERKQIVVVYRKGATSTYHQIALPHPASTVKWTENLLGDYEKGSFQSILTLKDNSKFIINCKTEAEGLRMIARAKALINPEMILNPSPEVVSQRRGAAVSDGQMYGRSAMYFSQGQRSAVPDWRAEFAPLRRV